MFIGWISWIQWTKGRSHTILRIVALSPCHYHYPLLLMKKESFETSTRRPYTKGWDDSMTSAYGLPIKKGNKVISLKRPASSKQAEAEETIDEEDEDEDEPVNTVPESEFLDFSEVQVKSNIKKKGNGKNKANESMTLAPQAFLNIKMKIAEICTCIVTSPEQSLRRSSNNARVLIDGDEEYKISDLFEYIEHGDLRVAETAILSALLIFKDIVPGYPIRTGDDKDDSVTLKKETKRILDYEQSLLQAYKRYLNFLESFISNGLSSPKTPLSSVTSPQSVLAIHALRCQCELLRSIPHFNMRPNLITSIVAYATYPLSEISSLCCGYLARVIEEDVEGDISYEVVRAVARALIALKHDVPEDVLHILEVVKVRTHEDEAKKIRKQVKKDKRKRKKDGDDVEARLLEAEGVNPMLVKRRQADSLKELCLIYFRILKNKVGFRLLPVALEGLARLTHLINMDTVMDLLADLKRLLETKTPVTPLTVRLHCCYCALRTLTGPGKELEMDDEAYVCALSDILQELVPTDRWDLAFECVELCLIKKRETRKQNVIDIVYALVARSQSLADKAAATALALAHTILVHYPTIRSDFVLSLERQGKVAAGVMTAGDEEERVEDLAMIGLLDKKSKRARKFVTIADVFATLSVLRKGDDIRLKELVRTVTGRDITPAHYNCQDGRPSNISAYSEMPKPKTKKARVDTDENDTDKKSVKKSPKKKVFQKSKGGTSGGGKSAGKADYRNKKTNRDYSKSRGGGSSGGGGKSKGGKSKNINK